MELGTARPVLPADGEGVRRTKALAPFLIDCTAVTNARFATFVAETGYVTEAERIGWSFVFFQLVPQGVATAGVVGAEWWRRVDGADWRRPEGPGSDPGGRDEMPVTQISWNDARAFAAWAGGRLPTEAEWEHAARGGLSGVRYPWGDADPDDESFMPCNVWQGRFPDQNTGADGYRWLAPARSFAPNGYGLYNMVGNCWEWTEDAFRVRSLKKAARPVNERARKESHRVMKGGSYLCHRSYCFRYRIAARIGNPPDTATGHLSFRCVYDA